MTENTNLKNIQNIAPPGFINNENIDMNNDLCQIRDLCYELMHKPLSIQNNEQEWVPSNIDIQLFHIIIEIFKNYTMGIKDIIGVRQIIKNKYGNNFVNKFNKLLSSKSLLWKVPHIYKELDICLKKRSNKFIMVVKNENKMFYLIKPGIIPEGFYVWNSKY